MATIKQVHERVTEGQILAVAEYRGFRLECIRYRDKKTGAAVSAPIVTHAVELGAQQAKVSEWLPDGTPVDDKGLATNYQPQFKKGDQIVIKVESLKNERGSFTINGTMFKLEIIAK